MKPSAEALQSSGSTAIEPERNSLTSSAGSRQLVGSGTTSSRRPTSDNLPALVLQLRSIKLYEIRPDDQTATSSALKILEYCLLPVRYEEAVFWIGRLLAHFPRRDAAKDGIVISDIAGELVERQASLVAVCAVSGEVWKEATRENPFMPPSGEIVNDIMRRTDSYRRSYERLRNPVPALIATRRERSDPYGGRKWPEMSEEQRKIFKGEIENLRTNRRIAISYCKVMAAPEELVDE